MDPDAIFIILLYIAMLILTIGSMIGLSHKIWQTNASPVLKSVVVGSLIGLLVLALVKFNGVERGDVLISRWEIMIYAASFLIGLNGSINLSRKSVIQAIRAPGYLKIMVMTLVFAILIPTCSFYSAGSSTS